MNVIIVAKFLKAPKKIMLRDPRTIGACSAALLLLLGLGAFGGFLISGADTRALQEIQVLRTQITEQQDDLDAARGEAQRELNAMSVKLAELQAQSNRLNALGVRLTRIGRLEDGEFNFDEVPAVGGPAARSAESGMVRADLQNELDALGSRLSSQAQQLELLESLLLDRDIDASLTPTGLPVRTGYASSGFGHRADPFGGYDAYHAGVDFNGPRGSDILSVADGVVSFAGRRSGYGNVVDVDHGNGYMTRYAHNSQNLAQPGQRVRVGQVIAKMGATGRATGNHVHFEVWLNDRPVNPKQYLLGARG
ncbi:MAG: peptidoglycan DD-metalloendopeptidase family protein [Chiayiivirga sp.]|jgi:murein DD-endopeptidase MepM/ murein hydrolase activator NlpD|uniref:M23 family metallopeptidase n=1 Tax=Chiayiivirga sp. TaxID=2041042 RepID=UPI0025C0F0FC|nr:M23 family metallopeptidase [Chiayiivirga sp.]MCI1728508.1 peptidoglycan DD-metalloendopeptidase family protein [Chiayiivirga sp.]